MGVAFSAIYKATNNKQLGSVPYPLPTPHFFQLMMFRSSRLEGLLFSSHKVAFHVLNLGAFIRTVLLFCFMKSGMEIGGESYPTFTKLGILIMYPTFTKFEIAFE